MHRSCGCWWAPLGLPFVNADQLARIAYPDAPEAHSYEAAQLARAA